MSPLVPAVIAAISGLLVGYGIATPVGAIAILRISISATTCLCIGLSARPVAPEP